MFSLFRRTKPRSIAIAGTGKPAAYALAWAIGSPPSGASVGLPQLSGNTGGLTLIYLLGKHFSNYSASAQGVTFDGVAGTNLTVISDTLLRVRTPAHAAGAVNVVLNVTHGGELGTQTIPSGFLYTADDSLELPAVTDIAPVSGAFSSAVTITGKYFQATGAGANVVKVGTGTCTAIVTVNDTSITCNVPAADTGNDVTVTNNHGAETSTNTFTYV